jgi:hypothetical protein
MNFPTNTTERGSPPRIPLIYGENKRVTDGTRTRALRSHNPPPPLFPGVAVCCRIGLDKPISLLAVAQRFCV